MNLVILDNLIFSLQKAGGISTMWSSLISELMKFPDTEFLFMEYPGSAENICRKELLIPEKNILKRKHAVPLSVELLSSPQPGNYLLQDGTTLSEAMRGRKVIFHSPYYRTLKAQGVLNVVTLHDMTHEILRISSPLRRKAHIYLKHRALSRANAITCVSETTLNELLKIYPKFSDKSMVIPNGISVEISGEPTDLALFKYLMFIGGRNGYKHFDRAVEFARLAGLPLLICGNPLSQHEIEMLEGVKYKFEETPTSARLFHWMRQAHALLYMSDYEGFALPIFEAQALGCPVVVSESLNILPAIKDSVLTVNEINQNNVFDILFRLNALEMRSCLQLKGKQNAAEFTAEKMAQNHRKLYNSITALGMMQS